MVADERHYAHGRQVREAEAKRSAEVAAAAVRRRRVRAVRRPRVRAGFAVASRTSRPVARAQAAIRAAADEAVHARNAAAVALGAMEASGVLFSGAYYSCRACNEARRARQAQSVGRTRGVRVDAQGRECPRRGAAGHAPAYSIGTPHSPPQRAHALSLGPCAPPPHHTEE